MWRIGISRTKEEVLAEQGYLRADSKLPQVVRMIGEHGARQGRLSLEGAENKLKAYQQVSWIYASVGRYIDAGAFVPFNVVRMAKEEEALATFLGRCYPSWGTGIRTPTN